MSVLRTAALRLAVPKPSVARRFASTGLAIPEEFQQYALKDSHIPSGVKALELPVPASLPENEFLQRRHAVEDHSEGSTDLWRKVSWYIAFPAIIVSSIYVYQLEKEHEEHLAHAIEENGGVPPERKVYSYMNVRAKPFPWGNQALFYNERYNIGIEEDA